MTSADSILRNLMTKKCQSMQDEKSRCFKKGKCDGQCPYFMVASGEIDKHMNNIVRNCRLNKDAYFYSFSTGLAD